MKFNTIIGIDPGISNGGIAVIRDRTCTTVKMPKFFSQQKEYFEYINSLSGNKIAFIEMVQMWVDDLNGKNKYKALQMQKLFSHFAELKSALIVNNIQFIVVHPATWQSFLRLRIKGYEGKKERKNRYKIEAQSYFPETKMTLQNCDAVLLAVFGYKKLKEDIEWIAGKMEEKNLLF